jgi:hypothetical protein
MMNKTQRTQSKPYCSHSLLLPHAVRHKLRLSSSGGAGKYGRALAAWPSYGTGAPTPFWQRELAGRGTLPAHHRSWPRPRAAARDSSPRTLPREELTAVDKSVVGPPQIRHGRSQIWVETSTGGLFLVPACLTLFDCAFDSISSKHQDSQLSTCLSSVVSYLH